MNQKLKNSKRELSFVPSDEREVHFHNHDDYFANPHMHSDKCDRFTSGFDQYRRQRFYFTSNVTPLRVYLNYEEQQLNETKHKYSSTFNGRKFSSRYNFLF